MRSIGIVYYAQVDGCALGFRTPDGGIPRKRFTVATNDKTIFDTLNFVRCDESHEHTQLIGGAATAASGHYTVQMARLIHKAWRNSVQTRASKVSLPAVVASGAAATRLTVPAMPCVAKTNDHRQKAVGNETFYGALVAKSFSRKEMIANKDAYKALQDEAIKLANPQRPVWVMESVCEWSKVKERARLEGIK